MTNKKLFQDTDLGVVLLAAFIAPFKLQSDFARDHAQQVAALASMGLLSTAEGNFEFGRKWRVTGIGLDKLRELGKL